MVTISQPQTITAILAFNDEVGLCSRVRVTKMRLLKAKALQEGPGACSWENF